LHDELTYDLEEIAYRKMKEEAGRKGRK